MYVLSCIQLFAAPWTVACQAPLFMGFPRQEYWIRLPFPPPGDLPHPEIEPQSPALTGGSLSLSHQHLYANIRREVHFWLLKFLSVYF